MKTETKIAKLLALTALTVGVCSSFARSGEIHDAAYDGDIERVAQLIKARPDCVNEKNGLGETALHKAAAGVPERAIASIGGREKEKTESDYRQIAEFLLDHKADLDARDNPGRTPLHTAAIHGQLEIIKTFVARKSEINAKDTQGWTPLHWVAMHDVPAGRGMSASAAGVMTILLDSGANVDARGEYGNTPLYIAADYSQDSTDIVKVLIARGADVNAKGRNGETPLHRAASRGNIGIIRLLIVSKADVNAKDKHGATPLHESAYEGRNEAVEFLVKNNADIDAKNEDGKTALQLANEAKHGKYDDVAAFLRQHGAKE